MHNVKNGQTRTARFLKYVWPFYNIVHKGLNYQLLLFASKDYATITSKYEIQYSGGTSTIELLCENRTPKIRYLSLQKSSIIHV